MDAHIRGWDERETDPLDVHTADDLPVDVTDRLDAILLLKELQEPRENYALQYAL